LKWGFRLIPYDSNPPEIVKGKNTFEFTEWAVSAVKRGIGLQQMYFDLD
jgi:hypothetical protein